MRRALISVLSIVLTAGTGVVALGAAPASAKPKIEEIKQVTVPIEVWTQSAAQTPGGRLDYCAVAAFVTFGDIAGYEPVRVDYTYTYTNGTTAADSDDLEAPYDDVWTWGPLSRNAPAGKHQEMLGDQASAWVAGSPDCTKPYATTTAAYTPHPTAVITYEPTDTCQAAIDGYVAADKALTKAKKKLAKASPAKKAAARAAVTQAKKTFAKAKAKYRKKC